MLASGGTDVVNGQLIAGPFSAMYMPAPAAGPTIRGAGANMGQPTLPYVSGFQAGDAGQAGRVLSTSSILVLGAMLAASVLLMYHIHWS